MNRKITSIRFPRGKSPYANVLGNEIKTARITGKIPAGWKPGEPLTAIAHLDGSVNEEQDQFIFKTFSLYTDPEMTQYAPHGQDIYLP